MVCMRAKPTPVLMFVKGNSFGIFSIPGTNVRSIERKRVPWASALRSKNSAQERIYPDIAQVSGIFWQKSSPAIDHWNGVRE